MSKRNESKLNASDSKDPTFCGTATDSQSANGLRSRITPLQKPAPLLVSQDKSVRTHSLISFQDARFPFKSSYLELISYAFKIRQMAGIFDGFEVLVFLGS